MTHGYRSDGDSTRTVTSVLPNWINKLAYKFKVERKICAREGCGKYIPFGKHIKTIYCSTGCSEKAKRIAKAKREGRKLVWRGIRRQGL